MVKSIDEVFEQPFSAQTIEEKVSTLLEGKPRPALPNVFINGAEFDISFYDTEMWITACERRRTFFCWSCLLFVPENESEWTKEGYDNYELLHDGMKKHGNTADHTLGIEELENFVRQKVVPFVSPNCPKMPPNRPKMPPNCPKMPPNCPKIPPNCPKMPPNCPKMPPNRPKMPETNKNYLRNRLLDSMLVLLSHSADYPTPKGNEFDQFILAKCTRDLILLTKYEKDEFDKIIENFSRPEIVSKYLETLSSMMKTMIMEEIRNCTYVSLIINEHFYNRNGTLISFMFRYIIKEKICHRFLMFAYITTKAELCDLITNILKEFDIKKEDEKFLAFSLDSAMTSVMPLGSFVSAMKQDYGVLFFPCYFHSFETIIERSISEVDNRSRCFFKLVSGIRDYIKRSPKMQAAFNDFVKGQLNLHANQSSFKFMILLQNYKDLFSEFFKGIKKNMKKWLDDDVIIAIGLHRLLNEPNTIISMQIFSVLSSFIVKINDILCSSKPERVFIKYRKYKKKINEIKTSGFQNIWGITCAKLKEMNPEIFISSEHEENFRIKVENRFDKIVKCVLETFHVRIDLLLRYKDYLSICSSKIEKIPPEDKKDFAYFPKKNTLNPVELQNEADELQIKYPALTNKTDYEIYKFLVKEKLQDTYATLFKALHAILTTPFKTDSLDNSMTQQTPKTAPPKWDAINFWSKVYHINQKFTNNWSFVCIERDFLNSLLKNKEFYSAFYTAFEKDYDLFKEF